MRNVLFFRGTSNVWRQRRAKRVRCTPGLGRAWPGRRPNGAEVRVPDGTGESRPLAARTVKRGDDEVHGNWCARLGGRPVTPLLELAGDEGYAWLGAASDGPEGVGTCDTPISLDYGAENDHPVGGLPLELGGHAKVNTTDLDGFGDVAANAQNRPYSGRRSG